MTAAPGGAPAAGCFIPVQELPRAYGPAPIRGRTKADADDFRVEELLGFEPSGEGAHVWLQIRKRDTNTSWLAGQLARLARVPRRDVGYAGLKDRAALTTQWFSVALEGRAEPDWTALDSAEVRVLRVTRHRKKLRRGVHKGNRFRIRVRGLGGDRGALGERVAALAGGGAPNYFGEQRFGRDGGNIGAAWEMLVAGKRVGDRGLRGLYLSAARGMLFNRVLARRIVDGSWRAALPGEVLMLDGSHSVFVQELPDAAIEARVAHMDLHPTGPLWGSGGMHARGQALALEAAALEGCRQWCDALAAAGLAGARRALRVPAAELCAEFDAADDLVLGFVLPAGAYATVVLRELVDSPAV